MVVEHPIDFSLFADWHYSEKEWDEFVVIEKANKRADNIYFGIAVLLVGPFALMFLRQTTFFIGLLFSAPFAILIPWLRTKISYKHLKKGIQNPSVKIYADHLLINDYKIELTSNRKRVKSLKIIDSKNGMKLLEFDVQWITGKGPTNDEFRILIPTDKIEEAENLIPIFKKQS